MNTKNAAALVSAAWILGGTLAGGMLLAPVVPAHADPGVMSQSDFPCAEDEYLGYSPVFGPDEVGCIHIDDLFESRLAELEYDH